MINMLVSTHPTPDGFLNLPVYLVDCLEFDKTIKMVIAHTRRNQFYTHGTIAYFTEGFNASGFIFRIVDRGVSINVHNLTHIDKKFRLAYFEKPTTENSKSCTISGPLLKSFLKEFPEYK